MLRNYKSFEWDSESLSLRQALSSPECCAYCVDWRANHIFALLLSPPRFRTWSLSTTASAPLHPHCGVVQPTYSLISGSKEDSSGSVEFLLANPY